MANFTAEKWLIWKIVMKTLIMVTLIKLTQEDIGKCNMRNYFLYSNGKIVLNSQFITSLFDPKVIKGQ